MAKHLTKIIALSCLASAFVFDSAIAANQSQQLSKDYYLGLSGGYTFGNKIDVTNTTGAFSVKSKYEMKNGPAASIFFGKRFDPVRVELEESFLSTKMKRNTDDKAKVLSTLINLYYDIPVTDLTTIYAGGGIGFSYIKMKSSNDSDSDLGAAYQAKAGLQYQINDDISAFAEYSHMWTNVTTKTSITYNNQITVNSEVRDDFNFNKASIGIVWHF